MRWIAWCMLIIIGVLAVQTVWLLSEIADPELTKRVFITTSCGLTAAVLLIIDMEVGE